MKLCQNVYLDEISDKFEKGHVRLKARSLGQIIEKPCVCCRSHIFSPMIMKLCQKVCRDEILDKFENVSCQVIKGHWSNLRKTFPTL